MYLLTLIIGHKEDKMAFITTNQWIKGEKSMKKRLAILLTLGMVASSLAEIGRASCRERV